MDTKACGLTRPTPYLHSPLHAHRNNNEFIPRVHTNTNNWPLLTEFPLKKSINIPYTIFIINLALLTRILKQSHVDIVEIEQVHQSNTSFDHRTLYLQIAVVN